MNLDNLTIPEYWTEIRTGDVYKITMIDKKEHPIKYRLRMSNPKCSSDETSFYHLTEEQIR